MKFLILLLLNIVLVRANIDIKWKSFKLEYGKEHNETEDKIRKELFAKTLKTIKHHNEKNFKTGVASFEMGLNEHVDLTDDEYRKHLANAQPIPTHHWELIPINNITGHDLPNSVNWFDNGFRNPVINQGLCGSCYAMASTAAVEGHYYIKYKQLIQLSQQEILDCSIDYGNNGCEYGFMQATFDYILSNGVGAAANNPYLGIEGDTFCSRVSTPRYFVKEWFRLKEDDEYELMKAVAKGPVVAIINSGLDSFRYYNGGIYNDDNCSLLYDEIKHLVIVIGYNTTNDGQPYWIIKNSWGNTWGIDGYMHMARNADNICGIASQPVYPEVV